MFVPINIKSAYSILDSSIRLDDYLARAKALGYEQVGLADTHLYGAYRFIEAAKQQGLKPILGLNTQLILSGYPASCILVAKTTLGYQQLLKIETLVSGGNHDLTQLKPYLTDIALVFKADMPDHVLEGEGLDYYIIVDYLQAAYSTKRPIALPSIQYLTDEDASTLAVMTQIKLGQEGPVPTAQQLARHTLQAMSYYEHYYQDQAPQALANLSALCESIDYDIRPDLALPVFDKNQDAASHLSQLAQMGLDKRGISGDKYQERLAIELAIINEMGFNDYFLIVADLLRYARSEQIYTGMGRGSAVGSLVAYVLEITQVDPVKHGLLFERFLNPERYSMPDIDIDVPDNKRVLLMTYIQNRYGSEHVAQIITFSTFGAKQALVDSGKVFGKSKIEIESLSKKLTGYQSLAIAYAQHPGFRAEILKDSTWEKAYKAARALEGLPRQTSIHASGLVLADEPLTRYTALNPGDPLHITQYEAKAIEAIGLLKIDLLSMATLSRLERMQALLKKRYKQDLDFLAIDLEDRATLTLFQKGQTLGIFQFENPMMRDFLKRLQPTKFEDLVQATSIFRPGASAEINRFLKFRSQPETIQYLDEELEAILAPSYGIIIYQEQIMQIAQRFAGFSLAKADLLRRAISKKSGKDFEQLKAAFLAGAKALGHDAAKAQQIYALIEQFAAYGFNRSHAYAYAAVSFQSAYIKAHYPDVFYEVMFNYSDKRQVLLADARHQGFELAPLDINQQGAFDRVYQGKIYLGLYKVKQFSRQFVDWLIETRQTQGPFVDCLDVVRRLIQIGHDSKYSQAVMQTMVEIGLLDRFDRNRGKLVANIPGLLRYYQGGTIWEASTANPDYGYSYVEASDYTQAEKYQLERQVLGIAITPHQLLAIKAQMPQYPSIEDLVDNQETSVLVELVSVRFHRDKRGAKMAFLKVTDTETDIEVILFSDHFHHYDHLLVEGNLLLIKGKVSRRADQQQLVAHFISDISHPQDKLWLRLADEQHNAAIAKQLQLFPGVQPVILYVESTGETRQIQMYVAKSEQLLKNLAPYVLKALYRQ